jgi:signal transduction histidine kinase
VKIRVATEARRQGPFYALHVESRPSPLNDALGWRLPPLLLDLAPTLFIVIIGAGTILVRSPPTDIPKAVLWLGVLGCAGAVFYRRRAPLVALGVTLVISFGLDYGPIVALPTLIALFTVAEYCRREQVFAAAVLTAIVLIVAQPVHGHAAGPPAVLSRLVAVGLAVAAGLYLRARADYIGGLRDRATRLERERELLARQAAGEERVRIARELHDVVAHNVSLMVVQAQALAATGNGDDQQRAALGRLADLGRDALSEMHRMLGVLRLDSAGQPEREPQPGVAELDRLITRTAESGLEVSLTVEGKPRQLPSTVDLSAYRIVQEALTNVIRHAEARHAEVVLNYAPDALLVSVTDDGKGPQRSATNGGHGLVGMQERVALFGGALETGPAGGGRGYRVHASLPTR